MDKLKRIVHFGRRSMMSDVFAAPITSLNCFEKETLKWPTKGGLVGKEEARQKEKERQART